jgi:hypothetical protein
MKRLYFVLLLFGINASAQTIVIRKVELVLDKVIVTYDLEDSNPNNEYFLNLYASKDNFGSPLKSVTGDIGPEVKPGTGKKIQWSIMQDYGNYKGKLSLEVRGKVFVPVARLQNFDTKKKYKRGTSHSLNWKPGNNNPINIELYKGGQRIGGDMNIPNNGGHPFFFPKEAKPGSDYRLKITDPKNPDEVLYTGYFKVTPKVPMYMKIAPVVLVGALVAVLLSKDSGGGDPPGNGETPDIETPTLPGG